MNSENGDVTTCQLCSGPWHPATGAQYSERGRACYMCVVEFWKWFRHHQGKKYGGVNFYEHAFKQLR